MRFDINLASQRYEDVRRFFLRWQLALIALALLTAVLVYAAGSALVSWRATYKEDKYLRQQIAERDRQKSAVQSFLDRPENRDTRDRSQFLNALIARKAFSWTEVFNDLETLVPARLEVNSISPQVNQQGELEVRLMVIAPSHDVAVELVRRLEGSPHFTNAQLLSEARQEAQGKPPVVKFEISAVYIPLFARTQQQAQQTAAGQGMEARNDRR